MRASLAAPPNAGVDHAHLVAFARRLFATGDSRAGRGAAPGGERDVAAGALGPADVDVDVDLEVEPLRGGLEAASVVRVVARATRAAGAAGRGRTLTFVAKRLDGAQRREAATYADLLERYVPGAAPRLLGVDAVSETTTYLYLEYARAARAWPWREVEHAALVLDCLATVHTTLPPDVFSVSAALWAYDAELHASAAATLDVFERVAAHESLAVLRGGRMALRRMVAALPAVRRQLLAAAPLGTAVLHGDAHSGNAIVRAQQGTSGAVLLDWGRARLGSPLEDVSSWLQSLGYWEPVARQRHDTLLRRYLAARGLPAVLGGEMRDAYWLAGACNVLAGALRYHLVVADGWGFAPSRSRAEAACAAYDHLRVLRRADAVWRR
jgi:hypothetical protein